MAIDLRPATLSTGNPVTFSFNDLQLTYGNDYAAVFVNVGPRHAATAVALIMEPLVQGAGGMLIQPPGFLREVRRLADEHDVLLICDEVATGFGRTGKMFACEHEDVRPDIMCVAKGITGGYLPLAATFATQKIFDAFLGELGLQETAVRTALTAEGFVVVGVAG